MPQNNFNSPRPGRREFHPQPVLGYFCIGGAALFWAISASLGRAVFTGRLKLWGEVVPVVPPLMLAQSRSTMAVIILFALLVALRGRRSLAMSRRDLRDCAVLGIFGVAVTNYAYYLAIQRTSVATAIIVQYTAPAIVLLWMLARRVQRATVARVSGVVVAFAGCVLAVGLVSRTEGFPWLGIAPGNLRFDLIGIGAAVVSAVFWSFYNIFGRHLIDTRDRWSVLVWALAWASAGWLLVNPPWKVVAAHYNGRQWAFMVLFSLVSSLIPSLLYLAGLHHLDATRAIVTGCLEPVLCVLLAAVTLGERMGWIQMAGMALVLASTLLVQLEPKQQVILNIE